ncbi:MAG TPA: DUF6036 family nucleotidyltransferase [Isosphaeraceae bacterium]|nr:DUF6036 family nucleotidyltransferase [Isosphaeraceae bacterium]
MSAALDELWNLLYAPTIDPHALSRAISAAIDLPDLDYRTVQLLHEACQALGFSDPRVQAHALEAGIDPAERKFPTLKDRIVPELRPEQIRQYLRELGTQVSPAQITIGGSTAITLQGLPPRPTDDIDVVNEVPAEIRQEPALISQLARDYGISLTHFQSQFLPDGWELRVKSLGSYGNLQVSVVDTYDILAGKVYSARTKDRNDLRRLAPHIDREKLRNRLQSSTRNLWKDDRDRHRAIQNWYVVYGEDLDLHFG